MREPIHIKVVNHLTQVENIKRYEMYIYLNTLAYLYELITDESEFLR